MLKKIGVVVLALVIVIGIFLYFLEAFSIHTDQIDTVTFDYKGDTLEGSLYLPGKQDAFDVVVFIHGDNAATRDEGGSYAMLFNAYLDKGIACYSYDKAGVGQSEGNWLGQTMEDRAEEVNEAIEVLRLDPRIKKIGVMGMSQGGWVVSELAKKETSIDFVIIVSGAIDWTKQKEFSEDSWLERTSYSEEKKEAYRLFSRTIDDYIRADDYVGYTQYMKDHNQFDEGLMTEDRFEFARLNIDSNAIDGISDIKGPFLGIFGSEDERVDSQYSFDTYSSIFRSNNKANYELMMYEDTTHQLLKTKYDAENMNFGDRIMMFFKGSGIYTDGILDKMGDWVNGLQ